MKFIFKNILISIVLFISGILLGYCLFHNSLEDNLSTPTRQLNITVTVDDSAGFTTIAQEYFGNHFADDIVYLNLKDVHVDVGGNSYSLENAIRDGIITVEEICAYARIDARNGICSEKYECYNTLTCFTYSYPEFDIQLTYDVFLAPDGSKHLINDLSIFKSGLTVYNYYTDKETGESLNREDWGISFDVTSATPTSIELNCNHTGGLQIGELYIQRWGIYDYSQRKDLYTELSGTKAETKSNPAIKITQDTTSQFSLNWSKDVLELPSGTYELYLYIWDIFDETEIHPLMYDYSDMQDYRVEFTIP